MKKDKTEYEYRKYKRVNLNHNLNLPLYLQPEDLGEVECKLHGQLLFDGIVPATHKNEEKWY
ncbi:MAG: hypothetical protein EOL97_13775 [Spirochaetia bacterium]|nr:hypothetical protein [Spirochaetia bacterium]